MSSRTEILIDILAELRQIQHEGELQRDDGKVELPILLPTGGDMQLLASRELIGHITRYGASLTANDKALRARLSNKDVLDFLRRCFGPGLAEIDLDQDDKALVPPLDERIRRDFADRCAEREQELQIVFGATFLTGPEDYTTVIGPIRFELREAWLTRLESEGRVEKVDARRVRARWAGRRLKDRARAWPRDRYITDAIGNASHICTVTTYGLSSEVAKTKALLVARLALTVVALNWPSPTGALDMMRLYPDGEARRQEVVLFNGDGFAGTSSAWIGRGVGQWVIEGWSAEWKALDWVAPFGRALTSYVDSRQSDDRVKSNNALFSALWWFHQASRERTSLIATVKFASSLDALAKGGGSPKIIALIGARLRIAPDGILMKRDSRTTTQIIRAIYDAVRSQMLHGTHQSFGEDFTELRDIAEALARRLLVEIAGWLVDHPELDDVDAWRR